MVYALAHGVALYGFLMVIQSIIYIFAVIYYAKWFKSDNGYTRLSLTRCLKLLYIWRMVWSIFTLWAVLFFFESVYGPLVTLRVNGTKENGIVDGEKITLETRSIVYDVLLGTVFGTAWNYYMSIVAMRYYAKKL